MLFRGIVGDWTPVLGTRHRVGGLFRGADKDRQSPGRTNAAPRGSLVTPWEDQW